MINVDLTPVVLERLRNSGWKDMGPLEWSGGLRKHWLRAKYVWLLEKDGKRINAIQHRPFKR